MKVGGDYIKFENVGDTITGTVLSVGAHRWDDGSVSPQVLLQTEDGEEKTITAGQIRLKAALAEKRPEVGDTLTVTYADVKQPDGSTKTDATDIDAQGNVTITTPKEGITGDWAKYDPQTEKLLVGGNVKLVQGTTVLLGNELVSDLKTDRTQMKGGRVKGSFLPK